MKNQVLYNALLKAYGEVIVHSQGENIIVTKQVSPSAITRHIGVHLTKHDVTGGEYYAVCCPFCGDRKNRLWVSHAMGARIEVNGIMCQLPKGMAICYNEGCLKKTENWHLFTDSLEGHWKPEDVEIKVKHDPNFGDWTKHTVPIPEGFPIDDRRVPRYVEDYLVKDRGFDIRELSVKWGIRIAVIPFYDNPVLIIPVYQNNSVAFWQARVIGDTMETWTDGKSKPKYYIPPGSKKSWVVFNRDLALKSSTVVVTEGVFDAMKVGDCGVALFGKKPSEVQTHILHTLWRRGRLIWIPDENDPESIATAEGMTEDWNLRKLFVEGAHVVRMPDRDPGDQTRSNIWKWIKEQTGVSLPSGTASSR